MPRTALLAALAASFAIAPLQGAGAQGEQSEDAGEWRHALSLLDEPRYPADFERFDYVDPDAPKGGRLRLSDNGTFDTLNPVIAEGTRPLGLGLVYDTLMTPSEDEPSAEYGLIAEAVRYPDDFSSVTYRLREQARWHDGEPITPDDVIFSFEALTEHNPSQGYYYRHVESVERTGEREVTFTFDGPGNRELPQIVGQLLILPEHYWTGEGENGEPRDIARGTLTPPLGSGPYRIGGLNAGRNITYERVEDYWGADLPVNVGRHNFDEIRYEFYRDESVQLEAFRADEYDFRQENSALRWAEGYDFEAVREGRVVQEEFPINNRGIMQAFAFNIRRDKFADPRVRLAFNYAMNFEEMNQRLFYGQYSRINSYFHGTELASGGLPEGRELAILEEVREEVSGEGMPREVFEEVYSNPEGGDRRAMRENLRAAQSLFAEAGWQVEDGRLVHAQTGETMEVEFLLNSPTFERVVLPYGRNLERLGVQTRVRTVDVSQYLNRLRGRNFDVVVQSWPQSLSPGNEQRNYWGSDAADQAGSLNVVGIRNPAVDALIRRVIFAEDRDGLIAATRALDRVLLWNHYVVPQWTSETSRTARWDRFAYPEPLPEYSFGFPDLWWYDEDGAAAR